MVEAVLFDLDGTLLSLDMDEFLTRYIPGLHRRFSKKMSLETFSKTLMDSTQKMVENEDASKTLEEVFWEDFAPKLNSCKEDLVRLADEFYAADFALLGEGIQPDASAVRSVETALGAGYRTVLATNPIFPKTAIEHRMRWAGISRFDWDFVTTYEVLRFAKPNPNYYRSICEHLDVSPEKCVMVGNDTREDLVAGTLGMKTFLVEGMHICRHDAFVPDWRGSHDDLTALIERRFAE